MLDEFIKEYKDRFLKEFRDGFFGRLDASCNALLDPKNHPSIYLENELNALRNLEFEPMKVAIIGQFSSGKSSFLNTLLGSEVLPTGVVPVTAKATTIRYAKEPFLRIKNSFGGSEIFEISEIFKFSDQRFSELRSVTSLEIYLNSEILKGVTLVDTPGLNSLSRGDTNETLDMLNEISAIIWISLIDNAARKSEQEVAKTLPSYLEKICLLSQKDRLNKDEIGRVLAHSKDVFKGIFKNIIPISSKLEKQKNSDTNSQNIAQDSGFSEVREFLNSLDKESFIKGKFGEILEILRDEREFYIKFYIELREILDKSRAEISKNLDEKSEILAKNFTSIYYSIKENSSKIAKIFEKSVKTKDSFYFKFEPKKGLLGKDGYAKISYQGVSFNKDEALSNLIFNSSELEKTFRIFRRNLSELESEILEFLDLEYAKFEREILLFKGRNESRQKVNPLHSVTEISKISKVAGSVYELFLKDFEREFFILKQSIQLFFEKIDIKIATNYKNAVYQTVSYIDDRVRNSVLAYEKDPLGFMLFYPKFEDFNERILVNLNYYEFESDFIGSSYFIKREFDKFHQKSAEILSQKKSFIDELKSTHEAILGELNTLKI